jgi:hypothetical protein
MPKENDSSTGLFTPNNQPWGIIYFQDFAAWSEEIKKKRYRFY